MPLEDATVSEYSARFGFLRADLWRYPLLSVLGVAGIAMLLLDTPSDHRELPRSLEQAVGLLSVGLFIVMVGIRLATGIFRPLALRADRSGLRMQPFGLLSGYVTVPWKEIAAIEIRTDSTRTPNQWLVVERAAKSGPLRRYLPFTAMHGMAASRVHGCDLRYDVIVSVGYWWHLDRERLAAAVEAFAPRRVRLDLRPDLIK